MAIRRSPGCTCCGGCDVVELDDLNYSLTAGEVYQLPGTINDFHKIELTNLLPEGYFASKDDWFDIGLYEYDAAQQQDVLIQNIRYQPLSLGHSYMYYGGANFEGMFERFPYAMVDKWRGLGARINNDWHLIQPNLYNAAAGVTEACITSVSSGTFDGSVCRVITVLDEFLYRLQTSSDPSGSFNQAIRMEKQNCLDEVDEQFGMQKSRYCLFSDETTFSTKVFRYNNTTSDTTARVKIQSSTDAFVTIPQGDVSASYTRSTLPFNGINLNLYKPSNTFTPVFSSQVKVSSVASVTGPGHFEIECGTAFVETSGTVDIRVIRTGGNSEAVDVDVYYNGSTSTVNFSAGDNYKTITVNAVSHTGLRSEIDLHNDNTPPSGTSDLSLNHIYVRKDSWEIGSDTPHYLSKKHDTEQSRYYWYKGILPFEKDGTLWKGNVKLKVTSSKNVTLGSYGVTKVRNDATCDVADENQKLCPIHQTCNVISDFTHYAIDFSDSTGDMHLPDEEKHVFVNGCDTQHLFRGIGMDFESPYYVYRRNSRFDEYSRSMETDPIYLIDDYTPPTNTSFITTRDCDNVSTSYTHINDYTVLPSGYVFLGQVSSIVNVACISYLGGSELITHYADYDSTQHTPPITPQADTSIADTKHSFCEDFAFSIGDRNYIYTTDSTSALYEVIARTGIRTNYVSSFDAPDDTSDTSFEIISSQYMGGYYFEKGVAFQWNGTAYDMIGQDRIHDVPVSFMQNRLSNQLYIDNITLPYWFFDDGSYYYLKPNSGSALTIEGPFSTPEDTTNSVSVTFEGKSKFTLDIHYSGAESNGIESNSYYPYGSSSLEYYWLRALDEVYDVENVITVTESSSSVVVSPVPLTAFRQLNDPYVTCGEDEPCSYSGIDAVMFYEFGSAYWESTITDSDPDCTCYDSSWIVYEEDGRNPNFTPPASAADCDWLTCVPDMNPDEYAFRHCVRPQTAKAYATIPTATTETYTAEVGTVCDCPNEMVSTEYTQSYLDFSSETEYDGTLFREADGYTTGIIKAVDLLDYLTPGIDQQGYMMGYAANGEGLNYRHADKNSTGMTNYSAQADVCDYTDMPTLTFSESDLSNVYPEENYGNGSTFANRQFRFMTGYQFGELSIVDWHDPRYQDFFGSTFSPVCWKMWEFANVTFNFIDVHPRYTSPQISKFATLWPK